ncbi:MAG: hypothetical protein AAFQ82_03900 [Myxococcota bacterium]
MLFLVGAGAVVAILVAVREWQMAKRFTMARARMTSLGEALDTQQRTMRRLQEDIYVLQSVLRERNLLNEQELAQARDRLVEQPKRVAAERDAIKRHHDIGVPTQLIEDSLNKVH